MNKKRTLFVSAGIAAALIGTIAVIGFPAIHYAAPLEAATTRKMTFDSSHTSFTTSAGNTFSSYWIDKTNNSNFNGGVISCLAYMEGTATRSSSDNPYTQTMPCFGIRGNFNISNVSKFEIDYKVTTSNTICRLYLLTEDGSLSGSSWTVFSLSGAGGDDEQTKTISLTPPNSHYGYAFKVMHQESAGGMNDKMWVYIKSFRITYSC